MAENSEKEREEVIFISYGREEEVIKFVKQLSRDLEANGYCVWLDQESISSGSDWHGAIATGLHECTFIIPVITQKYVNSRYCMNELYTADGDHKMIFPIMYDDPELIDFQGTELGRSLKFIISGINWTMFRPGRDDYVDSLSKLIQGLKAKANHRTADPEESKEKPAEVPAAVITAGPSSSTPFKVISEMQYPSKIATGRDGEIVIASYMSHNVHVYNRDCELERTIGCQGYMDGQFMCPSGIAIDKRNQVYVSSVNKVDIFTIEGQFLNSFGGQGDGQLEFSNATDVAVGKKGEIYVADAQNNRVQVLNRDLSYRTSITGGSDSHDFGKFSQPQAIAVNSEGNLYVADMMNHCVQAFTPDGTFLLGFGEFGAANVPGALCTPMGIAIDGQDNVYVGNSSGTICIFNKEGNFLRQFGSSGGKLGQFNVIRGMHVDKEGQLYVSEWNSNRVQIFEGSPFTKKQEEAENSLSDEAEDEAAPQNAPRPAYMIGPTSQTPVKIISELKEPHGIAEGKNGEVIVASSDENNLLVYTRKDDYKLLMTIGGEGNEDGMFRQPRGVAITPDNLILVSSFNKLQWFTMEGKLVYAVGDDGKEEMEFDHPIDVAVSRKDGRIFVLDKDNNRVQILTGDATYHSSFKLPANEDNSFTSVAINSEGNLYFTDSRNNCIHVYSSSGEFLFKFGKTGSVMERGTLHSPNKIAIDNDDYVYIASSMMVSIFDKTGQFIRAFGGTGGSESGEFSYITGLHISNNSSHLYVSDYNNNRVQIFEINQTPCERETSDKDFLTLSTCRRPVYTVGPTSDIPVKVLSGGDIGEPVGVAVTESGDLLVLNKKKKQVFFYDSETYVPKDDEISQLLWETSRDTEIVDPKDITICEDGCLLMCVRNQLVKLTMSEEVIASVGKRGNRGKKDDELDTPDGIAVSRDGLVYVADKGNHRVQVFNSDLSYRGTCVNPTSAGGAEMDPERVAVNSKGDVYVTDRHRNCIYVFDASGNFLFEFGQRGRYRDRGSISSPVAIAIDQQDYIYISASNTVSIFDREGVFIRSFGKSGEDPGMFKDIKAMHIDYRGNLYVCESGNNRIQVFAGIESQPRSQTASPETTFCDILPKAVVAEHTVVPLGITEGKNGEIVVISATDHKVYVFDQKRELVAEFGGRGDVDGYFNFPTSVAVTTDNLILVSSHNKLQWFTITGQLVYAIGSKGSEEMEFNHPDCIVIGKDDRIYVLEKKNKRVQIINGNATYHSSFKLKVDHPPDAIAVNSQGEIYLVDTKTSSVVVVSQKGKYVRKIVSARRISLARPTAIAIDDKDQVFIGTVNGIIVVFDKEGKFHRAICGDSDPAMHISTHFNLIRDLHVSRSGHIYVSNLSHNQVQIIGPFQDCAPETLPSASPSSPILPYRAMHTYGPRSVFPVIVLDGIKEPSAIISGPNNDVLIASHKEHKIYSYNPTTQVLYPQITELVNREGHDKKLRNLAGLALSIDGYLLVSSEHQLLKLALDGTVVAFVGNQRNRSGQGNDELEWPKDIIVTKDGRIFVIDRGNHRIQIFDKDLQYLKTLCNPDSKERKSEELECMAFNSAGDLYVTDSRNGKVQVYNHSGRFKLAFGKKSGSRSYNRGELSRPHAVAVDREDLVYVGDSNGIVSIFNKKGKFLRSFGGSGEVKGLFGSIKALHIDSQGGIYVGEWKNDRIQVFQGQ